MKDKLNKGIIKFSRKKFPSINWVNHSSKNLKFQGNHCHTKKNPDEKSIRTI